MSMRSCKFEVSGKVQGVFFRQHCVEEGQRLGLVGWCMNTSRGTVAGEMQGSQEKVQQMQVWLKSKGSPGCRIDSANFSEEKEISEATFSGFERRYENT